MTISLIGYGALSASATNGATQTYAWPSGYSPVNGDLALLIHGGWMSDPASQAEVDTQLANATPSGYTFYEGFWRDVTTNDNLVIGCSYKVLNGSESAPQVTVPLAWTDGSAPGGVLAGYIIIYRGVHTSNLFYNPDYQEANSAAANTFQISSVTTLINNLMLVEPVIQGDNNTIIAGSMFSWTFRAGGSSYATATGGQVAMAFIDQLVGTAGVVTPGVFNGQAADSWVGILLPLQTAGVPSTPGAPTVTPNAAGGFSVSWSAPANGGAPISQYTVEHSTNNSTWSTATTTSGTSVNVTGYGNNALRYFRIIATNSAGNSSASSSTSGTTWDVPGTPGAPTVTPNAVGGFSVSWSAPSNGGTAITGYTVQVSTDNSSWSTAATPAGTSANVSGYGNNSLRYFRVFATNAAGNGSPSASTSGTTWNVPGNVTTLAAVNSDGGVFGLSWTPPSNGGTAITDYIIEYAVAGSGSWNTVSHAALGAVSSYNVTGLNVSTSYDFRIKATNAVGNSAAYSNTATAAGLAKGVWGLALNT